MSCGDARFGDTLVKRGKEIPMFLAVRTPVSYTVVKGAISYQAKTLSATCTRHGRFSRPILKEMCQDVDDKLDVKLDTCSNAVMKELVD